MKKIAVGMVSALAVLALASSMSASASEVTQEVQADKGIKALSIISPEAFPSESEPNDTKLTANLFGVGKSGTIGKAGDVDWFKFTADITDYERVRLLVPYGSYDYDLYVYDSTGTNVIASSTGAGNADETLRFNTVDGQTYYIVVKGYSGFSPSEPYEVAFY